MFTFAELVDTYTKGVKTAVGYVQPESFRTTLLDLADKQAEFAKTSAKNVEAAAEYVTKTAKETAEKFFPKQ